MKFALTMLAMPLAAMASPFVLEARATDMAKQIQANLTTLYNDIKAENTSLNAFANNAMPSVTQLVAVAQGAMKISADTNSTTQTATASSVLTAAESTSIFNYLNGTVLPATQSLLNNFIAHYPGLKADGQTKTVHDNLVSQKNLTDKLSTALQAKSQGTAKTNGPALTQKFDTAFTAAINKYSS